MELGWGGGGGDRLNCLYVCLWKGLGDGGGWVGWFELGIFSIPGWIWVVNARLYRLCNICKNNNLGWF